jgi:hypothetical protein
MTVGVGGEPATARRPTNLAPMSTPASHIFMCDVQLV